MLLACYSFILLISSILKSSLQCSGSHDINGLQTVTRTSAVESFVPHLGSTSILVDQTLSPSNPVFQQPAYNKKIINNTVLILHAIY